MRTEPKWRPYAHVSVCPSNMVMRPLLEPAFPSWECGFFFACSGTLLLIPVEHLGTSQAANRGFHPERTVRLHASGKWISTIGRSRSVKKAKRVDKDWCFDGSEGDATEKANSKA